MLTQRSEHFLYLELRLFKGRSSTNGPRELLEPPVRICGVPSSACKLSHALKSNREVMVDGQPILWCAHFPERLLKIDDCLLWFPECEV